MLNPYIEFSPHIILDLAVPMTPMLGKIRKNGHSARRYAKLDLALFFGAAKTFLHIKPDSTMRSFTKSANWLFIATLFVLAAGVSHGQSTRPPLLQNISVQTENYGVVPAPTPLIAKTGSSQPTATSSGVRTLFPVLAEVPIPGYSGILIESIDGGVVLETNANLAFNPASNVKLATAYAVLKTFGPDFRFLTGVYTDGAIDRTTGTLNGNIYVSGKDPVFGYEHAVSIANELNRIGISSVNGDLIVTDNFAMNYSESAAVSGRTLFSTFDSSKRSPAATRSWLNYLANSGRAGKVNGVPNISFTGSSYVQSMPSNLQLLFTHESATMRDILKATLCYSNNFLAERLGGMLGGPWAVARFVQLNADIDPSELSLQTSSGLGINRVTPNAMMKVLRALRSDLARYKMTFADIMPVAGIDKGTLEDRFDSDFSRGSLVGKTGTLGRTDGGVSALAGEVNTQRGRLLFVIFNQHGSVSRFRSFQNNFVSLVQGQFGGALELPYTPISLDARLSHDRITHPGDRLRVR